MLEKFKNKNVLICIGQYAAAAKNQRLGGALGSFTRKGTVTNIDENFIELDNNEVIAIQYIVTIESI